MKHLPDVCPWTSGFFLRCATGSEGRNDDDDDDNVRSEKILPDSGGSETSLRTSDVQRLRNRQRKRTTTLTMHITRNEVQNSEGDDVDDPVTTLNRTPPAPGGVRNHTSLLVAVTFCIRSKMFPHFSRKPACSQTWRACTRPRVRMQYFCSCIPQSMLQLLHRCSGLMHSPHKSITDCRDHRGQHNLFSSKLKLLVPPGCVKH